MVSPGHFSIWPNQESMDQFARNHGPHKEAIKAVGKIIGLKRNSMQDLQ